MPHLRGEGKKGGVREETSKSFNKKKIPLALPSVQFFLSQEWSIKDQGGGAALARGPQVARPGPSARGPSAESRACATAHW